VNFSTIKSNLCIFSYKNISTILEWGKVCTEHSVFGYLTLQKIFRSGILKMIVEYNYCRITQESLVKIINEIWHNDLYTFYAQFPTVSF
jgi:hypothetical protein